MDSSGLDLSSLFANALPPAGLSGNLVARWTDAFLLAEIPFPISGASSAFSPIVIVTRDDDGTKREIVAETLYWQVLVHPRTKGLGFSAPGTQFPIEVWNTYPDEVQTLVEIDYDPDAGIDFVDPYGVPVDFTPFQSRIYIATISESAPPQIDTDIDFIFEDGDVGGGDISISGLRLVLFSLAPDWDAGIKETVSYLTNVLAAYTDNEQRRGTRKIPRRNYDITFTTVDARSASLLDALLWGWQPHPFGVPAWPDAVALTLDLNAGALLIPVATTSDRLFVQGALVCIWSDPFTFDISTIEDLAAGSITISSPTQHDYRAGAFVVPVVLASIDANVALNRYSSVGDSIELLFSGEASQVARDFTDANELDQYLGIDVLMTPPNWGVAMSRNYKRSIVVLDSGTGGIWRDDKGGSALVGTPLPWFVGVHSDVTPLRALIDSRRGMLYPFWLPTWDQDLVLASDVGASSPTIVIEAIGYSRLFFPNEARRHLAFIRAGESPIFRKVTDATENSNGTETLTLDSPTDVDLPSSVQISFLALVRLDVDAVEIDWSSTDVAAALVATREVPREVPS